VARATIELPSMLAALVGGRRTIVVEAATLREAIEVALEVHPALRVHLFDESGAMRQHVLCFHNEGNSRWLDTLDTPLTGNDRITFLQAVSGG